MLAQRRPDEQVYVGPTSVSNVGPTESTTEKLRWPNVVMLSGPLLTEKENIIWAKYRHRQMCYLSVFKISTILTYDGLKKGENDPFLICFPISSRLSKQNGGFGVWDFPSESMTTHRQSTGRHDNSAMALFCRQPTHRHDHWPTRQVTDNFF